MASTPYDYAYLQWCYEALRSSLDSDGLSRLEQQYQRESGEPCPYAVYTRAEFVEDTINTSHECQTAAVARLRKELLEDKIDAELFEYLHDNVKAWYPSDVVDATWTAASSDGADQRRAGWEVPLVLAACWSQQLSVPDDLLRCGTTNHPQMVELSRRAGCLRCVEVSREHEPLDLGNGKWTYQGGVIPCGERATLTNFLPTLPRQLRELYESTPRGVVPLWFFGLPDLAQEHSLRCVFGSFVFDSREKALEAQRVRRGVSC
jgi:hypothetical protein